MLRFLAWLTFFGVLGGAFVGLLFYDQYDGLLNRTLPNDEVVEFTIPEGAGARRVGRILHNEGLIRSPLAFRLYMQWSDLAADIQRGEYAVEPGMTGRTLIEMITTGGNTVQQRLTFREGLTAFEIFLILRDARDRGLLDGRPSVAPQEVEGQLMPDTYFFDRGATVESIVARMRAAMVAELRDAWAARDESLPYATPTEALIMASVIQAEAGGGEWARVAGVFVNRLRRGMPLQADATAIYHLTEGQGQSVLARWPSAEEVRDPDNPYSSYAHAGLPPTPINNPGRDAIRAALAPESHSYLYFVADGSGGHAFAETLDEHNRNVRTWRDLQRARQLQQGAAE